MSLPHWTNPGKLRRLGLWLPFGLLIVGVAALTLNWFWMRGEIERRMERARTIATASGWTMDWDRRAISGFPFRLDVNLDNPRTREPSGWGVAAPRLKAEAFVFAPTHWVMVAPSGAVITRRRGGPLIVQAKALRASLSEPSRSPPRISIEGLGLSFTTPAGASPFAFRSVAEVYFHTKAGPNNQGAAYLEVDGADPSSAGLFGTIAGGHLASLLIDFIYSDAAALSGPSWPVAIHRWSSEGGALNIRRLRVAAGLASIEARQGSLSVGHDGRPRGALDLTMRQAPRILSSMAAQGALPPDAARAAVNLAQAVANGQAVTLPLAFQAGRTTLGPLAIGPAPRVY